MNVRNTDLALGLTKSLELSVQTFVVVVDVVVIVSEAGNNIGLAKHKLTNISLVYPSKERDLDANSHPQKPFLVSIFSKRKFTSGGSSDWSKEYRSVEGHSR